MDAFYKVPEPESPTFINYVYDICKKEQVEVITPIVTRELEVFAAAKAYFESTGIKIAVSDAALLYIANNKGLLLTAMKEAGLPTPEFRVVHTADSVETAIKELGYPEKALVVKPTFGNGSRGTRILDTRVPQWDLFFKDMPNSMYIGLTELMAILRLKDSILEMMVMEYLLGTDYSVDILADHGKVLYCACRKGLNTVSSIYTSDIIELNEEVVHLCGSVVERLKLDGNLGFDTKMDVLGRPQMLESNPRLTIGISVVVAAGMNLPYFRIKQLLGEPLPSVSLKEGVMRQLLNQAVFIDPDGKEFYL